MNITDPVFFATEYLGYTMPKHQRDWLNLGLKHIQNKTNLLFLGPADHGKSFVFSHILPLYLITMDRRLRIIISSGSNEGPANIGSALQYHLNSNEKLIEDFGSFRRKGRWNKKELKVIGANPVEKDPSFYFAGIGTELKYHRADIIICDDMVTLKNSQTQGWRDKIERFFFEILMNTLEPWGMCIMNGTREHKYDLYSKIEGNSEFETVIANPIIDEEKGLSLWPEMWPVDRLKKRKNMDFIGYQKRFCNVIADDDGQKNASKNIEAAKDRDRGFVSSLSTQERESYDRVYMSLDPNLSKKAKASRTVLMTMGFKGQDRYLLNMHRRTFAVWEYKDMVQMVKSEVERFVPDELFVESNSFGGLLTEQIREAKVATKVTSLWTGGQKKHLHLGIPGLYPILTNGQLHCPYKNLNDQALTDIFLNEVLNWPNTVYQDCVMTWYFIEKGTRKPKIKPESVRTPYKSSLSRFGRFKMRRR